MEHTCPCHCIGVLPFEPELYRCFHYVNGQWHALTSAEPHKHPFGLANFYVLQHRPLRKLYMCQKFDNDCPSCTIHTNSTRLPNQTPFHFKCSTYVILFYLITQPIFVEEYVVFCTALFPHPS